MAITLSAADVAAQIRVGDSTEELLLVGTRFAYASAEVVRIAEDAPDAVHNMAVVQIVGYLFDQPTAATGDNYANAVRYSGAGRMLFPYRVHRLGISETTADDATALMGSADNPVVAIDVTGTTLFVTFADGTTQSETLPAGGGGTGVDQTARDAAAAQATADGVRAGYLVSVDQPGTGQVRFVRRTGNTTQTVNVNHADLLNAVAWHNNTNYALGRIVTHSNAVWLAVVAPNTGQEPTDASTYWAKQVATPDQASGDGVTDYDALDNRPIVRTANPVPSDATANTIQQDTATGRLYRTFGHSASNRDIQWGNPDGTPLAVGTTFNGYTFHGTTYPTVTFRGTTNSTDHVNNPADGDAWYNRQGSGWAWYSSDGHWHPYRPPNWVGAHGFEDEADRAATAVGDLAAFEHSANISAGIQIYRCSVYQPGMQNTFRLAELITADAISRALVYPLVKAIFDPANSAAVSANDTAETLSVSTGTLDVTSLPQIAAGIELNVNTDRLLLYDTSANQLKRLRPSFLRDVFHAPNAIFDALDGALHEGSNITITPDAANSRYTIAASLTADSPEWHYIGLASRPFVAGTAKPLNTTYPVAGFANAAALHTAQTDGTIKQVAVRISQNDVGDGDDDHGTYVYPNNAFFRTGASTFRVFPGHALSVDPVGFSVTFTATGVTVTADAAIASTAPLVQVRVAVWM